jgi:hypothetical protein
MCRCKKFLKDFADWSQGDFLRTGTESFQYSGKVTSFLIVRNFLDNGARVVGYGNGILELDSTKRFLVSPPGARLRPKPAPGKMFFSNRGIRCVGGKGVQLSPSSGDTCDIEVVGFADTRTIVFPLNIYTGLFCANNPDLFRLQIDLEIGQTTYVDLTQHFTSILDLRCGNGVLYGFSRETTAAPWACVISLTKDTFTTNQAGVVSG